jgi:hypothetical protein
MSNRKKRVGKGRICQEFDQEKENIGDWEQQKRKTEKAASLVLLYFHFLALIPKMVPSSLRNDRTERQNSRSKDRFDCHRIRTTK